MAFRFPNRDRNRRPGTLTCGLGDGALPSTAGGPDWMPWDGRFKDGTTGRHRHHVGRSLPFHRERRVFGKRKLVCICCSPMESRPILPERSDMSHMRVWRCAVWRFQGVYGNVGYARDRTLDPLLDTTADQESTGAHTGFQLPLEGKTVSPVIRSAAFPTHHPSILRLPLSAGPLEAECLGSYPLKSSSISTSDGSRVLSSRPVSIA